MSDQERASRRARLEALREKGVDPYPARVGPRDPISEVRSRFGERDADELEGDPQTVAVAGRIVAVRSFGKLLFLRLVEAGEAIQVSARKKEIDAELFDWIRSFDVGDFVRFEGPVWRTRTGELSVDARAAQILAKSLRPLPEKWHGLADVESRFRQRYLDLLSHEQARSGPMSLQHPCHRFGRARTMPAMPPSGPKRLSLRPTIRPTALPRCLRRLQRGRCTSLSFNVLIHVDIPVLVVR